MDGDERRLSSDRSGRGPSVDLDALRDCLDAYPLSIAVVFGSTVQGTATQFSDLDVGVVFESSVEQSRRVRLIGSITATISAEMNWDAVDVVDLERASPSIAYNALSTGILVVGTEPEAAELEAKHLRRKLDFAPVKREWQAALDCRLAEGSYGRS
ncbi:type VII toxin-antitoxin system MntA family adenylyltransferase antitoxin [Halovivax gelatinilyticus]|uniref:type VII toxin-antitoxin system MntA family adenylyltransferase antitoxin n=1 Tax=Halovivax gelatinilyticus TaxID=2961597 RepID=UPI0020CA5407|nr:nucleotidyltransferase domain-containing protein [Halovivax gelatinilyticus]